MLEDRLLIRRFNHGDGNALRRIYEKYRDDLLKVAAALLKDAGDVEDVLHDVFVHFARSAGNFQLTGNLKGYLSICVANRARDKNRAAWRTRSLAPGRSAAVHADKDRPDCTVVQNELTAQLSRAMARIAYEQREVIVLRLQSNLKFRQIARSKGLSVNTIRSRYRYGLDKLRSILNGELRQ